MTPKQKTRLIFVCLLAVAVSVATALMLYGFDQNLLYFYSPSQVKAGEPPANRIFRVGGLVVDDSVQYEADGMTVHFVLTDTAQKVKVTYKGILPDLFREGQGIVAQGELNRDGVFVAEEVLAKHDENYMPPEVAEALQTANRAFYKPVK